MEPISRHPDTFPPAHQLKSAVGLVPVGCDIATPLDVECRPVIGKSTVAAQRYTRNTDKRTHTRAVGCRFAVYETITVALVAGNERVDRHHLPVCAVVDIHRIGRVVFQAIVGYPVVGHPLGGIESHLYAAHTVVVDVIAIDFDIAAVVDEDTVFAVMVDVVAGKGHAIARQHPDGGAGIIAAGGLP